jgi:hypothetical protein
MKKSNLSSLEIQDLINRYRSEIKKLNFQMAEVNATISQLEKTLKNVAEIEKSTLIKKKKPKPALVTLSQNKTKKKRGRPAKKAATKKKKVTEKKQVIEKKTSKAKKAGRPKKTNKPVKTTKKLRKTSGKKGYKLSLWDTLVVDSIKDSGKARITQEIIDFVSAKLKESGKPASDTEVKNKVIRSLQKLANRRNELKKVPYPGKGFAYAIPEWTDEKGKIKKEFNR